MLTTFPQWNFSLDFPVMLSQNHICYHWLGVSEISKMMHCGILINLPYWCTFLVCPIPPLLHVVNVALWYFYKQARLSQASDHDFIINYSFVFRFCYLLFQRAFEEPSHNAIIKHIFQLDRSSLHEYSFHFYDRNCGSEFLMCNILHFLYFSTFLHSGKLNQ